MGEIEAFGPSGGGRRNVSYEAKAGVKYEAGGRVSQVRVPLATATASDQRWSMDFVTERLENGRYFRNLTLIDQFSRECLQLWADVSLTGQKVVFCLQRLAGTRGLPVAITVDNGAEFCSRAMDAWAYQTGVKLDFIRPGRPVENIRAKGSTSPRAPTNTTPAQKTDSTSISLQRRKSCPPGRPRIRNHGEHRAGMQHDQKKGHLRIGGIQLQEFFDDDDVGRTRDGLQLGGALNQSQEKNLKKRRWHIGQSER